MYKLWKVKRSHLDIEKYSKSLQASKNYRIYAEFWYLDILTDGKWECWVYGDYEVIMPIPLQYKFGIKFVLQPIFCQQLGVFYTNEISQELFCLFEKKLHRYLVRAYHFNEENTETYQPKGEKRVNQVLDLNQPYEDIYKGYRKDRRKNIEKIKKEDFHLITEVNIESFLQLTFNNYQNLEHIYRSKGEFFELLKKRNCLIQYTVRQENHITNHRLFLVSKNRIFVIASARNKEYLSGKDFSSYLIDHVIELYAGQKFFLDFDGSNVDSIANFNNGFGVTKKYYCLFANSRFLFYFYRNFTI